MSGKVLRDAFYSSIRFQDQNPISVPIAVLERRREAHVSRIWDGRAIDGDVLADGRIIPASCRCSCKLCHVDGNRAVGRHIYDH